MKRILLFSLLISFGFSSFAQSTSTPTSISVPVSSYLNGGIRRSGECAVPYSNNPIVNNTRSTERTRGAGTVIGNTTYDEQPSNQRLFPGPNGSLSACWTGSTQIALPSNPAPWTDRGTFFNYFDGTNWFFGPSNLDATKLESIRAGFPSNVIINSGGNTGEWMCSHIPQDTVLGTMTRPVAGSGNWSVTDPSSPSLSVMWPHATAYGNTIHVIGTNDFSHQNLYLEYSRSTDGGQTWDVQNMRLPEEDSAHGIYFGDADNYAIDANKNTVAIVAGGISNGLFLWKSTDNGTSWVRDTIFTFPTFGGYNDKDTFSFPTEVSDGNYAVIVDNTGKVNVWFDDCFISNPDSGDGFITIYYPTVNSGLRYWNDQMPVNTGQLVATDSDLANTGLGSVSLYGPFGITSSFTGMPTASIDTTTTPNTLYCVFSEAVPFSNLDGTGGEPGTDTTAHSYRDLFGVYSADDGATWSNQANMTVSALSSEENVYPAAAKTVATAERPGSVDVIWMQDGTPGIYLIRSDLNPDGVNDIMYQAFTMEDFNGEAGVKNINGVTYSNLNVYPNPANTIANLNVAGLANEKAYITVTNLVGETVKTYNNVQLTGNIQMNTANLADGIYIVKVETSTHILTGKISVAH